MPHPSDPRFLVLHALRLKGFASVEALSAQTGFGGADLSEHLTGLQAEGLVTHREGALTGWALTADGRTREGELVAAETEACGARPDIDRLYRTFLQVNKVLLGVCTDWQMREADGRHELNDHADPVYDKEVLDRLRRVDEGIQPICAELAGHLERFGRYGSRLGVALERLEGGETEYFTKPLIESYHTVWFELHEDLLATLGIERSKEEVE